MAGFTAYARARIVDKTAIMDAYKAASEATGININTLKVRANREGWEGRLGDLVPVLTPCIPTCTTESKIVDEQRRKFLDLANKALIQWHKGLTYLDEKFKLAKAERNFDRAMEILRMISNHMLTARRIQEISSHATCDGGSATAPGTDGAPYIGPDIKILLAREIAEPRIPQPRPEPQLINLRTENGT